MSGWVRYFNNQLHRCGYNNAELARLTGLGDSSISKWRRGAAVPDLESCRKIAKAIRRPLLEVLVQAGHLAPTEAQLPKAAPEPELSPDEERVERLKRVLRDPKTPDTVRDRLRALLDIAEDVEQSRRHTG